MKLLCEKLSAQSFGKVMTSQTDSKNEKWFFRGSAKFISLIITQEEEEKRNISHFKVFQTRLGCTWKMKLICKRSNMLIIQPFRNLIFNYKAQHQFRSKVTYFLIEFLTNKAIN